MNNPFQSNSPQSKQSSVLFYCCTVFGLNTILDQSSSGQNGANIPKGFLKRFLEKWLKEAMKLKLGRKCR